MKKTILLFVMLLIASFNCNAQDVTEYVGKGKIFSFPNVDGGLQYIANVYFQNESMYTSCSYINSIVLYDNYEKSFTTYTTKHGDYISFQYQYKIMTSRTSSMSEQALFMSNVGSGSGYYAFVVNGSSLYLVDVKTDKIISTLESSLTNQTDFSLFVYDDLLSNRVQPNIWEINSGYVKIWNSFPVASSVKSISVDPDVQDKTFNISGIEIEDPQEGVYIKNGKKYIAK